MDVNNFMDHWCIHGNTTSFSQNEFRFESYNCIALNSYSDPFAGRRPCLAGGFFIFLFFIFVFYKNIFSFSKFTEIYSGRPTAGRGAPERQSFSAKNFTKNLRPALGGPAARQRGGRPQAAQQRGGWI